LVGVEGNQGDIYLFQTRRSRISCGTLAVEPDVEMLTHIIKVQIGNYPGGMARKRFAGGIELLLPLLPSALE